MSDCAVCLGDFADEMPEFSATSHPKARKPHVCCECERTIPAGAEYQRVVMKYDGEFWNHATCLDCAELREAFACDGGGVAMEDLWREIKEYLFPKMTTGCLEKVKTASAKAYLVQRWNEWKGLKRAS